jgi:thiamine biosynthesis protein ThiI
LGQVASQTLFNLKVVDQSITSPVLRPLIGLDKEDIIKIAKKIGTYDISILPSDGCRAVPSKPSTKAKIENILFEENKINIEKMVEEAVSKKENYLF